MSVPRVIKVSLILLAWLPLVLVSYMGARSSTTAVPTQAYTLAAAGARIARLLDYKQALPGDYTAAFKLVQSSRFENNMERYDISGKLAIQEALALNHAGFTKRAQALLAKQEPSLIGQALLQAWQPSAASLETDKQAELAQAIISELDGYYVAMAYKQLKLTEPLAQLNQANQEKAQRDFTILVLLGAVFLAAGLATVIYVLWLIYTYIRQASPANDEPALANTELTAENQATVTACPKSTAAGPIWKPIRALGAFVALNLLILILSICCSGFYSSHTSAAYSTFFMQIFIYVVVLFCLAKLLPYLLEQPSSPSTQLSAALDSEESSTAEMMAQVPLNAASEPSSSTTVAATLGLTSLRPSHLFVGLAGFGLVIFFVQLTTIITAQFLGQPPLSSNPILTIVTNSTTQEVIAIAALVAILGPIFEEIMYRGLLFGGLRQHLGPIGAGLISATMFSLSHGDAQGILPLAAMGLVLAYLYQAHRSLWPAIIAHGLWNGLIVSIMGSLLLLD